jgi:hypothetical protein
LLRCVVVGKVTDISEVHASSIMYFWNIGNIANNYTV